jgi:DNA gyrase/topoisomerase IV subunit A
LIKMVNSELAGFKCVKEKESVTLIFENGEEKKIKLSQVPVYSRGSQGVIISKRQKIIGVK